MRSKLDIYVFFFLSVIDVSGSNVSNCTYSLFFQETEFLNTSIKSFLVVLLFLCIAGCRVFKQSLLYVCFCVLQVVEFLNSLYSMFVLCIAGCRVFKQSLLYVCFCVLQVVEFLNSLYSMFVSVYCRLQSF